MLQLRVCVGYCMSIASLSAEESTGSHDVCNFMTLYLLCVCDCFVCPQHFQAPQFAILILVSVSTTCLGVMPPQQEKEESAQQFVQALRAHGMSEADICCHLKGAGYKTGRVNKLLAATRASGSRDAAPEAEEARLVLHVCVCVCLFVCSTRPE